MTQELIRDTQGFLFAISLVLVGGLASSQEPQVDAAEIRPLSADGLAALLQANLGDVVLVNLWATWCAPCLKEVPELIELEKKLGPQGFHLVGISLDALDAAAEIKAFRDEWFPDFSTYHTSDEDWFALIEMIDSEWLGVLPTSFVIDRSGELATTLIGGKDYQAFADAVEPLL